MYSAQTGVRLGPAPRRHLSHLKAPSRVSNMLLTVIAGSTPETLWEGKDRGRAACCLVVEGPRT